MLGFTGYSTDINFKINHGFDDFGIAMNGQSKTFRGYYKEVSEIKQITLTDGSVVQITFTVTIDGACEAKVGDVVVIDGCDYIIRTKRIIRDFGGNVISTKYGV